MIALAIVMTAAALTPCFAQQAVLALASGNSLPGGNVTLNISLASSGGVQPAGFQWAMSYPSADISGVNVVAAGGAISASKSVSCSSKSGSTVCIAYGLTPTSIANGVVATATFNLAPSAPDSAVPVQMSAIEASSGAGSSIASSGTGGVISVTQPVAPSFTGFSCTTASVAAPGSVACTATLSPPPLSGGFAVGLASNNANVSVPATLMIPAGSSSGSATAAVASIASAQTAVLTATAGAVARTFSLNLTPQTWSVSGTITSGSGATVALSGAASASTTADASGNYTFSGLANGAYTVTPTKSGSVFVPANRAVTVNSANVTAVNFTTSAQTWSISGTITSGSGATVALTGAASASATADASGNYTFSGLANGAYTVTPAKSGSTFTPASRAVTVNGANVTGVGFTAAAQFWNISGILTGGGGALVTLTGTASGATTADPSGNYTFYGVGNGPYTVTRTKSGSTFTPASRSVTVNAADVGAVNFMTGAQTWSISGAITGGSGAAVALTGAASASTTADASGNYTFSGLANGAYSVTPSKSGSTFVPANRAVTVNAANVTGVNFTTSAQTWSISGTITSGGGASVALSGTASASATADTSGNYTFSGLANGAYTVTPSKSGFSFSPASKPVSVNTANVTSINFTAAQTQDQTSTITLDTTVAKDNAYASRSITSPSFSTTSGNELLLAFIAADYRSGNNTSVQSVTGAGLTWVLVRSTRDQKGTAEIWRAFAPVPLSGASVTASLSQSVASSMMLVSLKGVDKSGTNGSGAIGSTSSGSASSGSPNATLVSTRNNSLVVGVGVDTRQALGRTPGAGQALAHQYLSSSGATFWVQGQSAAIAQKGTSVSINDLSPTSDPYNLAICEILAAPVTLPAIEVGALQAQPVFPAPEAPNPADASTRLALSNTASSLAEPFCSPGSLATLTWASAGAPLDNGGTALKAARATQQAARFPLPTTLSGLQVLVNGTAAPLLFASADQVNFQCPNVAAGSPLEITLRTDGGVEAARISSEMHSAAPGLFTVEEKDQGAVFISATNEVAMPKGKKASARPAVAGESLTLYATGLGDVVERLAAGAAAPLDHTIGLRNRIHVVVGGVQIEPAFAGLAPGASGLFQVNFTLPDRIVTMGSAVPLYLTLSLSSGETVESNVVTIAIADPPAN